MDILTSEQWGHMIRVVALDMEIKAQLFEQMTLLEHTVSKRSKHVTFDDCCSVCERSFHFFRRPRKCRLCERSVCGRCRYIANCTFCIQRRQLRYKICEWSILCSFNESQFGHAKYAGRQSYEYTRSKNVDWNLRSKMELHISRYLNGQIDDADVRIIVVCSVLERSRQRLASALEEFDTSLPFIYIDDALEFVQENARSGTVKNYPIQADHCSYIQLLSYAVVSFMVSRNTRRMLRNRQYSSSSRISIKKLPHVQLFNSKSMDYAGSSSSENLWTAKEPHKFAFTRAQSFTTGKALCFRPPPCPSLSLDARSQHSEQSFGESYASCAELSVRMSINEIHARSGELISISSVVHSEEPEVDVKWFNGPKEMSNNGRYRLSRKDSEFQLEIFDCDVTDGGEISCLAVNNTTIASDSAFLHVYEEDIAGEEPMFLEPLTFEQNEMSVTLRCSVIGHPIPYVTFHRRNRRIPSDDHIVIKREGEVWTLRIEGCAVDDEGKYVVIARNRIGRALSQCNVVIAHKPPASYISDV